MTLGAKSFRLTVRARQDLLGIGRYTERRWGKQQRNTYLKELDNAFSRLAKNPKLGRDCSEIKTGYLKYTQSSHVVFYRLAKDVTIEIIRILHKRMEAESQLRRT